VGKGGGSRAESDAVREIQVTLAGISHPEGVEMTLHAEEGKGRDSGEKKKKKKKKKK